MSYAVVRMQKMKSHALKGMQFHNQRERESKTNPDIDEERSHENYDLKNEKNIDYNERVKEIIESQKTSTRKTRKDAVLVNELIVTSDRDFFDRLDPEEQKEFFEESYEMLSERYGEQNIAYAMVHVDEHTPHMHLGVVPMRDGRLQGKNVFNRQELIWLQDNFPKHMQNLGYELKRGERGSKREHLKTQDYKKQQLEKEIGSLEKSLMQRKNELSVLNEEIPSEIKVSAKRGMKSVEVPTGEKNLFGKPKMTTEKRPTQTILVHERDYKKLVRAAEDNQKLKGHMRNLLDTDFAKENKYLRARNDRIEKENTIHTRENAELRMENGKLKSKISDLTKEIESIYKTTKEFVKDRTNDLQAFRGVFNSLIGKIKGKSPKSEIGHLHDHFEANERGKQKFNMETVMELDKKAKRQKVNKKSRGQDLEL